MNETLSPFIFPKSLFDEQMKPENRAPCGSYFIARPGRAERNNMKDTMILKDNTVIELEAGASLGALQVAAPDRAAMAATWAKLTPENLATVQIKNGDGLVVGNYTDLVLESETSVVASDGTVLTIYRLRYKTGVERLEERMAAVESGHQVHAGAINDLGTVVGGIAGEVMA